MLCFASRAARNVMDLRVSHINEVNRMICMFKKRSASLMFRKPTISRGITVIFSDASHGKKDETHPHIGYIIFTAYANVVHPISFASHKAKRVARSTLTAEALGAADAFDTAYFTRDVNPCYKWPIHLVTDSASLAALVTTTHDPREKRVKLDICALREAYEAGELEKIVWVNSKKQLADGLTKDLRDDKLLWETLSNGSFPDEISSELNRKGPASTCSHVRQI